MTLKGSKTHTLNIYISLQAAVYYNKFLSLFTSPTSKHSKGDYGMLSLPIAHLFCYIIKSATLRSKPSITRFAYRIDKTKKRLPLGQPLFLIRSSLKVKISTR
jgi:hypothetical protein